MVRVEGVVERTNHQKGLARCGGVFAVKIVAVTCLNARAQ